MKSILNLVAVMNRIKIQAFIIIIDHYQAAKGSNQIYWIWKPPNAKKKMPKRDENGYYNYQDLSKA